MGCKIRQYEVMGTLRRISRLNNIIMILSQLIHENNTVNKDTYFTVGTRSQCFFALFAFQTRTMPVFSKWTDPLSYLI